MKGARCSAQAGTGRSRQKRRKSGRVAPGMGPKIYFFLSRLLGGLPCAIRRALWKDFLVFPFRSFRSERRKSGRVAPGMGQKIYFFLSRLLGGLPCAIRRALWKDFLVFPFRSFLHMLNPPWTRLGLGMP